MRVCGDATSGLFLVCDGPWGTELQTLRPFSTSGSNIVPLALHDHNITLASCATTYFTSRPIHPESLHHYYVTTKKAAAEQGYTPHGDVYVSPLFLKEREKLLAAIDASHANIVGAFGTLSALALCGVHKIFTWRGSLMESCELPSGRKVKVLLLLNPTDVNAQPTYRDMLKRDIRRLVDFNVPGPYSEPAWNFTTSGDLGTFLACLASLEARLDKGPIRFACDIETVFRQIACISFATSTLDAFCIPIRTTREYWTVDEELLLIRAIERVLSHPNARVVGQNFHYDAQYLSVKWGIATRCTDDTMVAQHLLFPGLPKSLDFLGSVYAHWYQYWKDDLGDYKKAPTDDAKFFRYSCLDVVYTYEAMEKLDALLDSSGKRGLYVERMTELWPALLAMTLRGVRVNAKARQKLGVELFHAAMERQAFLNTTIGYDFNPRSTVQMKKFFYEEMGVKPEKSRITKKTSLGAENLLKVKDSNPLLTPIVDAIIELRSIGTFRSTFIDSALDADGRMRSFFALAGPVTFRLSSSENAFGNGANMQNIPKGDRNKTALKMPNIRELYEPDPGFEIFDIDLAGADAQVVAYESGDETMKQLFREKKKIAAFAAKELFGAAAGSDGKNEPYYTRAKAGGHASNYGAYPGTVAKALGITYAEAERFQERWFSIFPGIKRWQESVERQLHETKTIHNAFGYSYKFFGRVDKSLPEALAWIPQSTVAIVTNKAFGQMYMSEFVMQALLQLLMQVHDSIVFQLPIQRSPTLLDDIMQLTNIEIPYAGGNLIIPFGVKSSTRNWGECG